MTASHEKCLGLNYSSALNPSFPLIHALGDSNWTPEAHFRELD